MGRRFFQVLGVMVLIGFFCGCPSGAPNPDGGHNGDDSDGDLCDDGSLSLHADLAGAGGESGTMDYRDFNNCKEFIVRVQDFTVGVYDVHVRGIVVGQLTVGDDGTGELIYDSQTGTFPAGFPTPEVNDAGNVGDIATGVFEKACPGAFEICTGPDEVSDDDGGGEVDDDGGVGENNDDDEGRRHMTITLDSVTKPAKLLTAYVCVGDGGFTRENAPYNVSNSCSEITVEEAPGGRSFVFESGKTVTIIAIELSGSGTGGGVSIPSDTALYFVDWEGDDGQVTADGVQEFVMNRNYDVTVVFDVMTFVTWGKANDANPQVGGGCFDFDIVGAPHLAQGTVNILTQTRTCLSLGVANGSIVLHGHLKPGTVVTLTASEGGLTGLTWVGWEGGPCGEGRTCRIEVAEDDIATVAHWRSQ